MDSLTDRKSCLLDDEVFTVKQLLSEEECKQLIDFSEAKGYEFATMGGETVPTLRNNARVTIDDPQRSNWLWDRSKSFLPHLDNGKKPIGLNHRLRFYRYAKQQHFAWHSDGIYKNDSGQLSVYTLIVYLNGGFQGGETAFHDSRFGDDTRRFKVKPECGLGLCFRHEILHRSEPMQLGCKYVLRTDVMYT